MPNSAFVGQPPATDNDYWIVKGSLLAAGLVKMDPSMGLKIPPLRPPPDQYHFETRGPAIIVVSAVVIVIMVFVTVARLMVRRFKKDAKLGLDDWLMVPALILGILWPILMIVTVKTAGGGKHMYDVTYHEIYMSNWVGSFAKMDFFIALAFVKLSITCFNMRLTGISSRKWMYAHWSFFGIVVAFMLCAFFLITFQCSPVVAGWDTIGTAHLDKPPKCMTDVAYGNPLSFAHIVMDFILLAVPLVVLWKVQMRSAIKLRLYLLFSIGAICCLSAIMRQVSQGQLKSDPNFNFTALVYWTEIDMTLSIIVASLPVLGTVLLNNKTLSGKASKPSGASLSYGFSKPKNSHVLSSHSREGIIRQDEVELQFHSREADPEEGFGKSGKDNGVSYHEEQHPMPWTSSQR